MISTERGLEPCRAGGLLGVAGEAKPVKFPGKGMGPSLRACGAITELGLPLTLTVLGTSLPSSGLPFNLPGGLRGSQESGNLRSHGSKLSG